MKRLGLVILFVFSVSLLLASGFAVAADDSKVKNATNQVESGAKKIPDGEVGEGVDETAKGVGKTVSEGAKYSGEKLKEAGKAAEPPAKSAWGNARDGARGRSHRQDVLHEPLRRNAVVEGQAFHDGEQPPHVDRLRDVVLESRLQDMRLVLGTAAPREACCGCQAASIIWECANLPDEPVAPLPGHLEVAEEHIRSRLLQEHEGLLGGVDRRHRGARALQHLGEQPANHG